MSICKFSKLFLTVLFLVPLMFTSNSRADSIISGQIIALHPHQLVLESTGFQLEAEQYRQGDRVVYIGEPRLMTSNGISALKTKDGANLHLMAGQVLVVCKNQYIDYRGFSFSDDLGKKAVRTHLFIRLEGHESGCSCGHCGFTAEIISDSCLESSFECSCEQKDPIDPGKQACVIM